MANQTITIDAVLVDKVSGAVGKISSSWTEFTSAMQVAAGVGRLASAAYEKTVVATMKYADSVRSLTDVSSMSAEESSKFIQVLDDYNLTAQDALIATKALTKQGHEPSLETLARLSTEYNSINGEQAKNEFILKNLGKAGLEWARVLGLGEDAIRKMSNEVDRGLILSQKQLDAAEKNRLAQDRLNDSIEAGSVAIGASLLPLLATATEEFLNLADNGLGYTTDKLNAWSLLLAIAGKRVEEQNKGTRESQLDMMYATQAQEIAYRAAATAADDFSGSVEGTNFSLRDSYSAVNDAITAYKQFNGQLISSKQQMIMTAEEIHKWGERMYVLEETSAEVMPPIIGDLKSSYRMAELSKQEINGMIHEMGRLNGMESYVDIFIRQHGVMPRIGRPGTGGATVATNYFQSGDVLNFGTGNADGGQYTIPPSAGYEGMSLGALGTVSAGENVTITNPKKGQVPPGGGGITNAMMDRFADRVASKLAMVLG